MKRVSLSLYENRFKNIVPIYIYIYISSGKSLEEENFWKLISEDQLRSITAVITHPALITAVVKTVMVSKQTFLHTKSNHGHGEGSRGDHVLSHRHHRCRDSLVALKTWRRKLFHGHDQGSSTDYTLHHKGDEAHNGLVEGNFNSSTHHGCGCASEIDHSLHHRRDGGHDRLIFKIFSFLKLITGVTRPVIIPGTLIMGVMVCNISFC